MEILIGRDGLIAVCEALDISSEHVTHVEIVLDPHDIARVNISLRVAKSQWEGLLEAALSKHKANIE